MSTMTIDLEDELARRVEESARREHKSVAAWLGERVALVAAMEAQALASGYPPGWLSHFGSLAEDASFTAPERGITRPGDGE